MPALSPTMTEGTIGHWLKNEGDTIEPGNVIAEIETDKATMEFEAIDSGVLAKIIVPSNTAGVKVNSVIALIAEEGESIEDCIASYDTTPQTTENKSEIVQQSINTIPQEKNTHRIFVSPLAKNIAEQNNINLSTIIGTGPYGRIVKNDVLTALTPQVSTQQTDNGIEVSTMRKVIAARLLESKTTIPHFYLTLECNVSKMMELRQNINDNFIQMELQNKISINDMIMRAAGLALNDFPTVNTYWMQNKIIQNNNIDISVAVAIDDGLITPIVKNIHQKPLTTISNEIKSLVKKAKDGKLRPEEFQGGSITISNLGMYNIDSFLAIINPPQSCIISVGGIIQKPIVMNNQIVIGNMMFISISCDHRVIDGALAAQFLNRIKLYIENPLSLI